MFDNSSKISIKFFWWCSSSTRTWSLFTVTRPNFNRNSYTHGLESPTRFYKYSNALHMFFNSQISTKTRTFLSHSNPPAMQTFCHTISKRIKYGINQQSTYSSMFMAFEHIAVSNPVHWTENPWTLENQVIKQSKPTLDTKETRADLGPIAMDRSLHRPRCRQRWIIHKAINAFIYLCWSPDIQPSWVN